MFDPSNLAFIRRDRGFFQGILDTVNPAKRQENLECMSDWFMSPYDEEAKERTAKRFGEAPDPLDRDGAAYFAGKQIARLYGVQKEPSAYWLRRGKSVPEGINDRGDMFDAIGQEGMDWAKAENDRRLEVKRKIKAEQDLFANSVRSFVAGERDAASWEGVLKSLQYTEAPKDYLESINRARAAVDWARSIEDKGILEKNIPEKLVNLLLKDGEVDGAAVRLFADSVREKAQEDKPVDDSHFWQYAWNGLKRTVADYAEADFEGQTTSRGEMMAYMGNGISVPVAPMTEEGGERIRQFHKLKTDRKYIAGIIRELEDAQTKTDSNASLVVKALNGGGKAIGESAVWMAPHIGLWLGTMSTMQDNVKRELAQLDYSDLGDRRKTTKALGEAAVKTAGNTVAEGAFGFTSVFGKLGLTGKLLSKASGAQSRVLSRPAQAMLKAVDGLDGWLARTTAKSKTLHYISSHTPARIAAGTLGVWGEENIGENIVQSPVEYVARETLRLFGAKVDPGQITIARDIAQAAADPETSGGTFVFGLLMHAIGMRGIRREVRDYKASYEQFAMAGMKAEHARELMQLNDENEFCAKADQYYKEDVIRDPEGARDRAKAAGKAMMSAEEAEANRVTGAVNALMKAQGVGSVKQIGDEDRYELSIESQKEGVEATKVELTGAQLDAYIQASTSEHEATFLREVQARIFGEQSAKDANKLGFVDMLDMSEAAEEFCRDIEDNGGLTIRGVRALSQRAADHINALMEQGITPEEARATVDDTVMRDVQLGTVAGLADAMSHRVREAAKSGEITKASARAKLRGRETVSNVFRLASASDVTRSYILYAKGRATAADVFEDVKESILARYMRDNELDWSDLWMQLQEADMQLGGKLGTYEGEARRPMDVVEAFSSLALSSMLSNMEIFPGYMKAMAQYAKGSLKTTKALLDVGDAWQQFADSEAGRKFAEENGMLEDVLAEAGANVGAMLHGMKFEASSADAVLEALASEGKAKADKEAQSKNPKIKKLQKELTLLQERLERAANEKEAIELRNEIDNVQALIVAEETGIYVTPSYDWTARNEEGEADTASASASLAVDENQPLHIHENGIQYTRNGIFYTATPERNRTSLSEGEGSGDSAGTRDGEAIRGTGEKVQQGLPESSVRPTGEDVRHAGKSLLAGAKLRALTQKLHRFGGKNKQKAASKGFYTGDICELVPGLESANAFREAILAAKKARGLFGECVYVYSPEEYADMRLYLTPDGMAGTALKPNGDMVSVFSHPEQKDSVEGKTVHSLITLAINEGALQGDCYGKFLTRLYGYFGFRAVAKDAFNAEFASDAMKDENSMRENFPLEDGKPDVVYLVYEGNRANVLDEYNPHYKPDFQEMLPYTDYEKCLDIQGAAVEAAREKEQNALRASFSLSTIDPVIADVRDEMRAIRERAQAGGTYLKAPNGRRSNLSPHQWELVRTVGFRKWFGDWEYDPKNASKVIDENGEPLVVYHGTRTEKVRIFHRKKSPFISDTCFADKVEVADSYTYNATLKKTEHSGIYAVFMNLRNPFVLDAQGGLYSDLKHVLQQIPEEEMHGIEEYVRAYNVNLEITCDLDVLSNGIHSTGKYDGLIARNIIDPGWGSDKQTTPHIRHNQYRPYKLGTQVKSATINRGTFDSENPDITFSIHQVLQAVRHDYNEAIELAKNLKKLARKHGGTIYARYGTRKFDEKPDKKSYNFRDHFFEEGLSAMDINAHDSDEEVLKKIVMYCFLKLAGSELTIYSGELAGSGSDGEPLIKNHKAIARIDERKFEKIALGVKDIAQLVADIKQNEKRLRTLSDKMAIDITKKTIRQDYEKIDKIITKYDEMYVKNKDRKKRASQEEKKRRNRKSDSDLITFSIAHYDNSLEPILVRMHNARVLKLYNGLKTQFERWSVLTAKWGKPGEKVREGEAMEAFGRVVSMVGEVNRALPEGYRFNTASYLRRAYEAAKAIKAGEATMADIVASPEKYDKLFRSRAKGSTASLLSTQNRIEAGADATQRIDVMMRDMIEKAIKNIERYEKVCVVNRVNELIGRTYPKKRPNGKYKKGKMSADSYRKLTQYVAMTQSDATTMEARMDELRGLMEAATTQESADRYAQELQDWSVFGCLSDMSLEKTRAMERALVSFVGQGRTQWDVKREYDRLRLKKQAQDLTAGLGSASAQDLLDADASEDGLGKKAKLGFLDGFLSFSQFLGTLSRVPGMKGFARAQITKIAKANVRLRTMENERNESVARLIADVTGLTHESDQARWMVDFKQARATGITLLPRGKAEYVLTIEEARRWVKLTPRERGAERKKIRKDAEKADMAVEGIVPESATAEFARKLALLDAGKLKARKYITVEQEVVRTDKKTENLRISRAQAAYAVLLYEQTEYRRNFERAGFGEEQIRQLYSYLGDDGLKVAYGLREIVRKRGEELARVYEEREGVPFPAVPNYFRACFRVDHMEQAKAQFGEATNAIAGGAKYAMLIPRRAHNLDLALNMDAFAVFAASQAETENYIATSEITSHWRRMLADRDLADSIKAKLGPHYLRQLRDWLRLLDGAGAAEGSAVLAQSQVVARLQSARAVALLAWNALTNLKQVTAVFYGAFAGEVSYFGFLRALPLIMTPSGYQRVRAILASDVFRARERRSEVIGQLMSAKAGTNWSSAQRFAMAGMKALEKMDVWSNACSMAALYEAKKAELQEFGRIDPENAYSDEEMHNLCMDSVARAMELAAQPSKATQRSAAAQSNAWGHKLLFFMGSESVNKFGLLVMHLENRNYGQAIALWATMSIAEQTIIYLFNAMLGGNDDDDALEKYLLAVPFGMIGGVPVVGATLEGAYRLATGQRIYIGTGGSIIDAAGAMRTWKNTYKAVAGKKRMKFEDWCNLIIMNARVAGSLMGPGQGSRNKAIDSIASWLLSLAAGGNLAKPVVKALEQR